MERKPPTLRGKFQGLALDRSDFYAMVYDPETGNPIIYWSPDKEMLAPATAKPIVLSQFHITRQKVKIEFSR